MSGRASGTVEGLASRKPLSYTGKCWQQEGLLQGPTVGNHPQELCHHRVASGSQYPTAPCL